MRVVALTGNIASGKSTVARLFRELGTTVIDLDAVVHQLQAAGQPVFNAIVARFGPEVVGPDGELNRTALRDLILHDMIAKSDLEGLVHPAVFDRQRVLLTEAAKRRDPLAIVEIPLLFESGDPMDYDGIILVDAPVQLRRERLIASRALDEDSADRLIAIQMASEEKRASATWIIENRGDLDSLKKATRDIWQALQH